MSISSVRRLAAVTAFRVFSAGSVSLLGLAAVSPGVLAGESESVNLSSAIERSGRIEEVVVTARRRDESSSRVPATVSALTGEQLAARSINTEADLQRAMPGLLIRESLSTNQLNYAIRGQSVDAFSSSSPGVLSYVNEFQATATSSTSLYDLESVQVVKGPQGTLYGRNTTGGAVLYSTAKPLDELAASSSLKAGNYSMGSAEGFVSVPIVQDKLMARAAAKIARRDGFQDNEFHGNELGELDYRSGRISILVRPTDTFENITVYQYERSEGDNIGSPLFSVYGCSGPFDASCVYSPAVPFWEAYVAANPDVFPGGILAFGQQQRARGPYNVSLNSDFSHRGKQKLLTNNTTWDLSPNLTLKNVFGWVDNSSADSTDVDGTPYPIYANGLFDESDQTVFGNEQWSEELQLQGTALEQKLTWLVGGYYGYEERSFYIPTAFFDLRPIVPDVARADKDNVQESRNWGLFVHGSYDLGDLTGVDGLTVTAGYRYTKEKVEAKHLPRSLFYQLGIAPDGVSKEFSKPSWNVGLEYQLNDDTMMYVVQRGSWRSGGFNTNSQLFDGTIDVGGSEFLPETAVDVEVGVKFNGLVGDVPVQLNVAAYKQWVDDIQRAVYVTLPLFGPTALTANIPRAEIQGFELSTLIRPAHWLEMGVNLVYTDAEFTRNDVTIFGISTEFGPFPDTPEWSGSIYVDISLPIDPRYGELSLRGDLYAQSKFYFSSLNDTINPNSDLPKYSLASFSLNWENINDSKFGAGAFITNAFDKTYYTGGLALGSVLGLNAAIPGLPRMFGVELRVSL